MRGGDQAGSDGGPSPPPNKAERRGQMMLNHLQRLTRRSKPPRSAVKVAATALGACFQEAHLTSILVYGSCAARSLSEPFAFFLFNLLNQLTEVVEGWQPH